MMSETRYPAFVAHDGAELGDMSMTYARQLGIATFKVETKTISIELCRVLSSKEWRDIAIYLANAIVVTAKEDGPHLIDDRRKRLEGLSHRAAKLLNGSWQSQNAEGPKVLRRVIAEGQKKDE